MYANSIPSTSCVIGVLLCESTLGLLLAMTGMVDRPRVLRRIWHGGREQDPGRASTTALSFSNALRTFYSFIYRPEVETTRELSEDGNGHPYFIRRLIFAHSVAPIFGPLLFRPLENAANISRRLRALQSGHLNFYLALIGVLLVAILVAALI